ncbi:hypothetical protein JW962_03340 [Candidatus Dojkabacteria bacterium]|nr:hypothetical protein [Candidatus Dojkabacteria bacterium]
MSTNKKYPNILDITFDTKHFPVQGSQTAILISFYPYSRILDANSFSLYPYEEYVKDIGSHKQTSYLKDPRTEKNLFGLTLGGLIVMIFALIDTSLLISVEALVSVLGVYTIGKEIWDDLDQFLINKSENLPIQWIAKPYAYIRRSFGIMQQFFKSARNKRYGKDKFLANKFDFFEHSNSKTVDLLFKTSSLIDLKSPIGLLSVHLNKEAITSITQGYMLTVRLSEIKRFGPFSIIKQIHQAKDSNEIGCVDSDGNWIKNNSLVEYSITLGKLKLHLGKRFVLNTRLFS